FPSIGFLSFWWLLRSQRVPFAALWSLGLLVVSEAFIYRMSMPRVQTLSLAVLILALHWLMTGRQRWLLPLAFLYVWLYDAFPLILPLAGAYVAAGWLLERRLRWQPLAYAALGIALGLLVNPYFPENLVFLHRHILPKLVDSTAISVGSEWYPYRTTQLIENSGLALAAFLAGVLGLGLQKRRMGARTATLFLLSVLFGFMLFKSRRFIEYWPPFALLFSAFAWAPILRIWIGEKNSADEPTNANPSGSGPAREGSSWRRRILAGSLIAALLPALWFNLQTSRESVLRSKPIGRYAQASAWLKDHSPPGSRVFQTDWDDFPRLFFFNSHNTYTLGLDPTYMQLHDSELYLLWVDISGGRVELPSQEIRRTFGAEYVLTDLKHRSFLEAAERDPNLAEVYRDEHAAVFQVLLPDWGSMERSS
nr:hypothetical protein [Anaerolineae bacterium]NIN95980.1 hypothetical protein [Anaerolineae bacterium]